MTRNDTLDKLEWSIRSSFGNRFSTVGLGHKKQGRGMTLILEGHRELLDDLIPF